MAFKDRVEAVTKLTIDSGQPVTQNQLDELLTEGRREVTNAMPMSIKMSRHGHTVSSFTSTAVGSESASHEGGEVLWVTRNDGTIDQPCRKISRRLAARATDSSEMFAATVNDPVWYTNGNQVNALPASGTCKYAVLQFNTVSNSDSAITDFPDDYEYLVVLYASIKSLQAALADKSGNTDITTALGKITTELNETQAVCDLINTQVDAAVVELAEAATLVDSGIDTAITAINTAVDRVNTAVALANTQFDSAVTSNTAEDIELASSNVNAGNGFLSEAQGSLGEAQGYVNEVSARVNQVSAQTGVAQGYISAAQGFLNELQAKISIANGYASEVASRLNVISTEYSWMEKQQAKLQADYEKGIQIMRGDYKS